MKQISTLALTYAQSSSPPVKGNAAG